MQYNCRKCQKLFSFEALNSKEKCSFCGVLQKTPKQPWEPNVILGFRYKIIQEIGKGGHGVICLARDILEEKNYALKIFYSYNLNERRAESFLQEAQTARQFIHANIVRTYGGNSDGDIFYIVQSWICGVDLIHYEKNIGRITVQQACYILLKVANALQFIWDHYSVIHRDIKPANILIDISGNVLLTDFGIMMSAYVNDDSDDLHCTPDYVSPEAATGEDTLDIRSDFYSLGATMFRLLAGRYPFPGKDPEDIIMQRLENPPPHLDDYVKVPKSLSDIILKLMAYRKVRRFQSTEELTIAVDKCFSEIQTNNLTIKRHANA